jgi:hypothetical protein
LRALDAAPRRRAILPPWAARARGQGVEQDATEDGAHTRPGVSEVQGRGRVGLRRVAPTACEGAAPRRVSGEPLAVDRQRRGASRGVTALGATCTLGFRGALLAEGWPGRGRLGMGAMRQECRAVAQAGGAASPPLLGSAPLDRRDLRVWQSTAAEQGGHLWCGDGVMVGRAAVPGFQRARMPQHQGQACWRAAVGTPRPGEETGNGHDTAGAGGRHGGEARCRRGWPRAVDTPLALLTHAPDVHAAGRESATTVQWLWVGVEAPEGSSFFGNLSSPCQHTTAVC